MKNITIGAKKIGKGNPCLIVAELSANHNQKLDLAVETIRAAARAGADAIKLQTYTPDTITMDCDNEYFRNILGGTLWEGQKLYDLYQLSFTPWDWHKELFHVAWEEGLLCFSTPFDKTAVDFLKQFDPPAFKIASFEIQDIPLLEYAASMQKPMIISTGIAMQEDIELAIATCRNAGNDDVVLLHCNSSYPAPLEEANLLSIPFLKELFGVEVGLSDHTQGIIAPVVALSLGATVIEKHLILDKSYGGPDASFSLDEQEFTEMVKAVRQAEAALGNATCNLSETLVPGRRFGRSLFVVREIKKGEPFTEENVRSIRPAFGMHPKYLKEILGTLATRDYIRGEPLLLSSAC